MLSGPAARRASWTGPALSPLGHIVLDRPKIAANIAAICRTAAGLGLAVHVCGPTPFSASSQKASARKAWRAGLDYLGMTRLHFHRDIHACLALLGVAPWLIEVGGSAAPWDAPLMRGDVLVFGPEDGSIQDAVLTAHPERVLTLPQDGPVRSLNLAQCVATLGFELRRQTR